MSGSKVFIVVWLVTSVAYAQSACTQSVPVSVMEIDTGAVLTELHASDFHITLGGEPVTVVSAERDFGPRSVVLVLDVNRRITSSPDNWDSESQVARIILRGIRKKSRISMVAFAKDGMRRIGFNSGQKGIFDWLASVDANRGQLDASPKPVGVLDAIQTAVGMLPTGEYGSTIILITPGVTYKSQIGWQAVWYELARKAVRVFAFHPQIFAGGTVPEDPLWITNSTGGLQFQWPDIEVDNVRLLFDTPPSYSYYIDRLVLGQILAPIRLEIRVDSPPPPGAEWKVEILNSKNGKKRGGLYVVFPYHIPYCHEPSVRP